MTSTLPTRLGTYKDLQEHQQLAVAEWWQNVRDGQGQVGLWVYGNRGEGASFIGTAAMRRLVRDGVIAEPDWEYINSFDLMDQIRISWSADQVSRGNANDYDLYTEAARFEDDVKKLWSIKLLMVDDVYHNQDMAFFRKHIFDRLFQRVKDALPTVVATDMPPSAPQVEMWQKVIESWFVTCYAER